MLILLMSAVPVPLSGMFTVSMAAGSKDLDERGVLVTSLGAAEDAATGQRVRSSIATKQLSSSNGGPTIRLVLRQHAPSDP